MALAARAAADSNRSWLRFSRRPLLALLLVMCACVLQPAAACNSGCEGQYDAKDPYLCNKINGRGYCPELKCSCTCVFGVCWDHSASCNKGCVCNIPYYGTSCQNTCRTCSAGQYLSTPCTLLANGVCSSCPANTYRIHTGHRYTSCQPCPAGTYSEGTGNTACLPCSSAMPGCSACSSSKVCSKCSRNINNNPGYFIYRLDTSPYPDKCQEACSHWGSSSNICYPGKCNTDYVGGCACASGFSGSGCNTMDVAPGLSACFASMKKGGSAVSNVDSFCLDAFHQKTFYTNTFDVLTLDMSLNSGPLQNVFKAADYPINTQPMPNANQKFGNLVASMLVGIRSWFVRVMVRPRAVGGAFTQRLYYSGSPAAL